MAGDPRQAKIEELLGNKTTFCAARRSYQPQLCPGLAAGPGLARPLEGGQLEVLRVARSSCPL